MTWIKEHLVLTSALGIFAGISIFSIGYYLLTNEKSKDKMENKVRTFRKSA